MTSLFLDNLYLTILLPLWLFLIIMVGRFFSVYVNKNLIHLLTIVSSLFGVVISSGALYKIALASKHSLEIEFAKVPVLDEVKNFVLRNNIDYKDFVLWGGEDFELVACVPEETYLKLDKNIFHCIGRVQNKDNMPCVKVDSDRITKEVFKNKSYNHFKEL